MGKKKKKNGKPKKFEGGGRPHQKRQYGGRRPSKKIAVCPIERARGARERGEDLAERKSRIGGEVGTSSPLKLTEKKKIISSKITSQGAGGTTAIVSKKEKAAADKGMVGASRGTGGCSIQLSGGEGALPGEKNVG